MAEVIAFPLARRVAFIKKQAEWLRSMSPRAAEANLFHVIGLQRDAMLRRGIDPALIEPQCKSLEDAIRGHMARRGRTA